MTCILRSFMYKGGPHLACGDVGISPYRRLSGERDARGFGFGSAVAVSSADPMSSCAVPCRVTGGVVSLMVSSRTRLCRLRCCTSRLLAWVRILANATVGDIISESHLHIFAVIV